MAERNQSIMPLVINRKCYVVHCILPAVFYQIKPGSKTALSGFHSKSHAVFLPALKEHDTEETHFEISFLVVRASFDVLSPFLLFLTQGNFGSGLFQCTMEFWGVRTDLDVCSQWCCLPTLLASSESQPRLPLCREECCACFTSQQPLLPESPWQAAGRSICILDHNE